MERRVRGAEDVNRWRGGATSVAKMLAAAIHLPAQLTQGLLPGEVFPDFLSSSNVLLHGE